MNACSLLSFNLATCVEGVFLGWIAAVPWWAWIVCFLVAVGFVFRLAGWLGVVALAGAAGYVARGLQDAERSAQRPPAGGGAHAPPDPVIRPTAPALPPRSLTE